jgi:hypothetical protein
MNDNELIRGRPYGGCAILWKKSFKCKIEPVTCNLNRLCAVKMIINKITLLILNVYMPCDANDNNTLYDDVLNEIDVVCNNANCNNIVVAGDFNTDFSRVKSKNTISLCDFIDQQNMSACVKHVSSEVNYTYENCINMCRSTIDHFLVTENLTKCIVNYETINHGDNLSDHLPVTCHLDLSASYHDVEDVKSNFKCNWENITPKEINDYKDALDELLSVIELPLPALMCKNVFCDLHSNDIEKLYNVVCDACVTAGNIAISKHNVNKAPCAGWNDLVKEHRERAILWHNIWKSCGSPNRGTVADIRKSSRARYHLAVREAKRDSNITSANNLASAMLSNKTNNFWTEIKKHKNKNKCNKNPSQLDDTFGDSSIANLLADKFDALFHSVSYSAHEMAAFKLDLAKNIEDQTLGISKTSISVDDACKAIGNIKFKKSEGCSGMMSDHIKYGTNKLYVYVSLLFTSMLNHGFSPKLFTDSVIVPIPKNKRKSLYSSDNYRGICLGSVFSKILDHIIINKYSDVLNTTGMQFGFKTNHSTNMCTFVFNEVVQYYANMDTQVFSLMPVRHLTKSIISNYLNY